PVKQRKCNCRSDSGKRRRKMKNQTGVKIVIALCLLFTGDISASILNRSRQAQPNISEAAQKEAVVTHATGTFDVKLTPQAPEEKAADKTSETALGRTIIDKQLHGDLEGTSKGQMLTAGTSIKGSAGYVAIERVTGT